MEKPVKHLVGNLVDGIQRCIICGEIINDYTDVMYPAGQPAPKGFPAGPVYVSGTNPKIYTSIEEEDYIPCFSVADKKGI